MKNLTLNLGAAAAFLLATTSFALAVADGFADAVALPEPGTIAVFGAGIVGLVAAKVYRRKR